MHGENLKLSGFMSDACYMTASESRLPGSWICKWINCCRNEAISGGGKNIFKIFAYQCAILDVQFLYIL
jgi:hypothetical protein